MTDIKVEDYLNDTIKYHHKKQEIVKMMHMSADHIVKVFDKAVLEDESYNNKRIYGISFKQVEESDLEFRAFSLIKTITYAEFEKTYLFMVKNVNEPVNLEGILKIDQDTVNKIMDKLVYKHFGPTSVQGRRAEDFKDISNERQKYFK